MNKFKEYWGLLNPIKLRIFILQCKMNNEDVMNYVRYFLEFRGWMRHQKVNICGRLRDIRNVHFEYLRINPRINYHYQPSPGQIIIEMIGKYVNPHTKETSGYVGLAYRYDIHHHTVREFKKTYYYSLILDLIDLEEKDGDYRIKETGLYTKACRS